MKFVEAFNCLREAALIAGASEVEVEQILVALPPRMISALKDQIAPYLTPYGISQEANKLCGISFTISSRWDR